MKDKILVVGLACVSMIAAAQSNPNQKKTSQQTLDKGNVIHRDLATREASAPSFSEIRESPSKGSRASRESSQPSVSEAAKSNTTGGTGNASDRESSQPSVSEAGKIDGNAHVKTTATDEWHQKSVVKNANSTSVSTGDLDGDGMPDKMASKNSGHATEQSAASNETQNNAGARDVASGHTAGKRQHQPVTIHKEVDKSSPK